MHQSRAYVRCEGDVANAPEYFHRHVYYNNFIILSVSRDNTKNYYKHNNLLYNMHLIITYNYNYSETVLFHTHLQMLINLKS